MLSPHDAQIISPNRQRAAGWRSKGAVSFYAENPLLFASLSDPPRVPGTKGSLLRERQCTLFRELV